MLLLRAAHSRLSRRDSRKPASIMARVSHGALLLLALLLCAESRELRSYHLSGLAPHRIEFPARLYEPPSGVFNPAAVYSPVLGGHVFVWRHDACFYKICGVLQTNTTALVSIVPGNETMEPGDMMKAAQTAEPWQLEPTAHARLLANQSAAMAAYGDWRPFMWQGEVYVGHWVKLGWPTDKGPPPASQECISKGGFGAHSCELSTLSRLNFQTRQLELRFLFQKPLQGTRLKVEKNWGFMEIDGELHILYNTLPCTAVYRYDVAAPTAAVLVVEHCYTNIKMIFKRTGLNATDSRQSGNPITWRSPDGRTSLLAMVHSRAQFHTYAHWLVLLDPDTLAITHVSAGSVLQTDAFWTEGYMKGVLTVGSFHILQGPQGQALRLLLGEGDQYSAFEDIDLVQVVWWNMENDTLTRTLTPSPKAATPATQATAAARQRALL